MLHRVLIRPGGVLSIPTVPLRALPTEWVMVKDKARTQPACRKKHNCFLAGNKLLLILLHHCFSSTVVVF